MLPGGGCVHLSPGHDGRVADAMLRRRSRLVAHWGGYSFCPALHRCRLQESVRFQYAAAVAEEHQLEMLGLVHPRKGSDHLPFLPDPCEGHVDGGLVACVRSFVILRVSR